MIQSMKTALFVIAFLCCHFIYSQQTENIIIITTDGFRWQELFKGMDPLLASDKRYNQEDSALIYKTYWAENEAERRTKLMPFFWKTLARQGQIHGNRNLGSKVNVTNPYWFSYPGYNEIFSGYADEKINSNDYAPNPNTTVLEFLHQQPGYKGKVGVFSAWEAFNRILNEQRSGIPVIAAYDTTGGGKQNVSELLINKMLMESHRLWAEECLDVFTHHAAMEYLKKEKPRVLYIAYGETDEWAHGWKYRSYLQAATQVDRWIEEIWNYVQSNPQYRNKTTLLITTDHGRGDNEKSKWTSHGSDIEGADEIWFAVMGAEYTCIGRNENAHSVLPETIRTNDCKIFRKNIYRGSPNC